MDRIIVSHGHPDHWSGLEVLTARFSGAEVYALPGAVEFIGAAGDLMLGGLRQRLGVQVASKVTVPSQTIAVGAHTIDGIRLEFRQYLDAESNAQLVVLLPEQHIILAFDLAFAAGDHPFTVIPHFDHWIEILKSLKAIDGYDTVLIGHDLPTDPSAYDATIDYLKRAKAIYAGADDGATYAAELKAAFPQRAQQGWVDFSGMMLYRTPKVEAAQ